MLILCCDWPWPLFLARASVAWPAVAVFGPFLSSDSSSVSFGKLSAIYTKSISCSLQAVTKESCWSTESSTSSVYFQRFLLSSGLWSERNRFWFCFKFCKLALFWLIKWCFLAAFGCSLAFVSAIGACEGAPATWDGSEAPASGLLGPGCGAFCWLMAGYCCYCCCWVPCK